MAFSIPQAKSLSDYETLYKTYGNPEFRSLGGGALHADPAWEAKYLVPVRFPGYDRQIYINKECADLFLEAMLAAQRRAPWYKLSTIGCYNPRCKKRIVRALTPPFAKHTVYRDGTNGQDLAPSVHAFAAAIDINPDTNAFGSDRFDLPKEYVEEFERLGFVWGGRWKVKDAMHVQCCRGI